MTSFTLTVHEIKRVFGRKILFDKISFTVRHGESFAITGKNGSGKSTLVKILCGLVPATSGTIEYEVNGRKIGLSEIYPFIGLVSPYLNMYEEFSGEENLQIFSKIRGIPVDQICIDRLLKRFNIFDHKKKEVRYYSSGMKQRLKYCASILHNPVLLYLDEPTANLDDLGISVVREIMKEQASGSSLIFATNDTDDLKYADNVLDLNTLKIG